MMYKLKKLIRLTLKLGLLGIVLLGLLIGGSHFWIEKSSEKYLYDQVENTPYRHAGIVLGTSKRVRGGNINLYFKYRMQAAAALYKAGKIKYILVSGDNSIKEYNETMDMQNYLIKLGVPEEHIIKDYAGFSTLDSVLRAYLVFGQEEFTIISQPFHNKRALYIARQNDIPAIAFNAQEVGQRYGLKTKMREYLARVKAVLDVWVLHRLPKFHEEKEDFPE